MPFPLSVLALAALIVVIAYTALAVAGFGSALISIPLLALILPVKLVIPLVLIVDLIATVGTGLRFRRDIALQELKPIVVPMAIGLIAGITLLIKLPARWILLALGVFILSYGLYSLLTRVTVRTWSRWWAIPTGLSGGVISGLFGMGGPMYVIYLSGRVSDKTQLRATLSTIFSINTAARLILLLASGLLLRLEIWIAALCLLPFMGLGLYIGHRLHLRLTGAQIGRIISVLLLLTGASILVKAAAG
jgi:uncharacterized membrane protein YfcA